MGVVSLAQTLTLALGPRAKPINKVIE